MSSTKPIAAGVAVLAACAVIRAVPLVARRRHADGRRRCYELPRLDGADYR